MILSDVLTCTVPPLRVESSLLKNPILRNVTFPELFSNPVNLVHGSQGHHASPQSGQRLPYVFSGVRNEGLHLVEVESVLRLLGRRRHELIDLR